MRNRLPVLLAATAVVIAVFGSTPLGNAASDAIHAVPPFAKKTDFAKQAGNSAKLNGRRSALTGAPGTIPVVDTNGKLPASVGPDLSGLLGRTVTVTASKSVGGNHYDFVLCPSGYEAVGGGAYHITTGVGNPGSAIIRGSGPTNGNGALLPDGLRGGHAAGWGTGVSRDGGGTFRWSVVCAKQGS
jgi:hypothetical protein